MHPIARKFIERNADVELDTEFEYINYDSVDARYGVFNFNSGRKYVLKIFDTITEIHFRITLKQPPDMYEAMENLYPILIKLEKERAILKGIGESARDVHQWLSFYIDQKRIYETVPSASFMAQAGPYEHVCRQHDFYKSIVDNYSKKLYASHNTICGYRDDIRALGFQMHSKWL